MTEFESSAWDGSASNWPDANAYCADCLIDTNSGSEKVKDKCKLPYRKAGSSKVNTNALKAMVGGRGITAVQGVPTKTLKKAANWIIRKYQEAFDRPAPASVYRVAGKNPPKNKAIIHKDKQGEFWFFGIYSNNFEDREEEILTWQSHKEFVRWTKENSIKLPITVFHLPKYPDAIHIAHLLAFESGKISAEEYNEAYRKMYAPYAIGETHTLIPLNGFVIVIGKILKNKYDKVRLMYKSNLVWGMSHGFLPLERSNDGITDLYRSFELTILPNDFAANELTISGIVEK